MTTLKMSYGRKFWACIIALILLAAMFFTTLIVNQEAIDSKALIVYGILVVSVAFAYIGGNVWNKWVKSKFFQSEMTGGP